MFAIQRVVFDEDGERLIGLLSVSKVGKKEKKARGRTSYLCLTVANSGNASYLHRVKLSHDGSYSKRKSWALAKLSHIDNLDESKCDFSLTFDKQDKPELYLAPNIPEKDTFLETVIKSCKKYCAAVPELIGFKKKESEDGLLFGIDSPEALDSSGMSAQASSLLHPDDPSQSLNLSEEEQREMTALLDSNDWDKIEVKDLTEKLQAELQQLEAANVHALMNSRPQVDALLERVEQALTTLDQVDGVVSDIEERISPLRREAQRVAGQEQMIRTQQQNSLTLKAHVADVVAYLFLDPRLEGALLNPNFSSKEGREVAAEAAHKVMEVLRRPLPPEWLCVQSIVQQKRHLQDTQETFAETLHTFMVDILSKQVSNENHADRHHSLMKFSTLALWLREVDRDEDFPRFETLAKSYSSGVYGLYQKQFEGIWQRLTAVASQAKASTKDRSELSSLRLQFKQALADSIATIVPVILQEQTFCRKFFIPKETKPHAHSHGQGQGQGQGQSTQKMPTGVTHHNPHPQHNAQVTADNDVRGRSGSDGSNGEVHESQDGCGRRKQRGGRLALPEFQQTPLGSSASTTTTTTEKEASKQGHAAPSPASAQSHPLLFEVLSRMFNDLDMDISKCISTACHADPFNSVASVVVLNTEAQTHSSGSPFLSQEFGKACIVAKRQYDAYLDGLLTSITSAQVKKKERVGILSFVSEFLLTVKDSEAIVKGQVKYERLESGYVEHLQAVWRKVEEVAATCKKPDVVLFENYHNLYDQLSQLMRYKLSSLKPFRAEALDKYKAHLNAFVKDTLGHPMATLTTFFDGVEALIQNGTNPEEVGFYADFHEKQLLACIKQYPGATVKKGLEKTYRSVKKELSQAENLLVVVWTSIQEEFVRLHAHLESLIAKCYPGKHIHLDFEVQDLLQYFSSIAENATAV